MRAAIAAQAEGVSRNMSMPPFIICGASRRKWTILKSRCRRSRIRSRCGKTVRARAGARGQGEADRKHAKRRRARRVGSPTFFVGNEMFFGKEQLREVEELVAGK